LGSAWMAVIIAEEGFCSVLYDAQRGKGERRPGAGGERGREGAGEGEEVLLLLLRSREGRNYTLNPSPKPFGLNPEPWSMHTAP